MRTRTRSAAPKATAESSAPPRAAAASAPCPPLVRDPELLNVRRPFTVDAYHRMAEVGVIGPDERTELLDGEVVDKMTISSRHAACVKRLARLLMRALDGRALIGVQDPVRLDNRSEPEPDISVLRLRADDYASGHPRPDDVVFVVEIGDTSRHVDRAVKVPLYAAAGIPEVWLVDLVAETLEVHREPDAAGFRSMRRHGRGEAVAPAAFADVVVDVEAVLGPADDAPPAHP